MKIIGVGDNTLDCYLDRNGMFPGGNAVNVAVLGKRFGFVEAAYIGTIGNDKKGKCLYNAIKSEGVDLSHSRVVDGKNSYVEVELKEGDRVFKDSYRGVSYNLDLNEDDYEFISKYNILHTSIYSNIEKYLEDLSKLDVKLSFDFSDCFDEKYLDKYLKYVDYAFFSGSGLSDNEVSDLIEKSKKNGCELVLVTKGKDGAILYYKDKVYEQGIVETEVVDTLGAGDAFIASVLIGLISEENIEKTLQNAALNASKTCGYFGGFGYEEQI